MSLFFEHHNENNECGKNARARWKAVLRLYKHSRFRFQFKIPQESSDLLAVINKNQNKSAPGQKLMTLHRN